MTNTEICWHGTSVKQESQLKEGRINGTLPYISLTEFLCTSNTTHKKNFFHFFIVPNFELFSLLQHTPVTNVTTYKMVI
jgi:hypothetical protein